jgi:hypothetical protein
VKFKDELAAKWRAEIEELEERAGCWETGKLRAFANGVEVTAEKGPMLLRHAAAVREALAMLESD